MNRTIFAVSIAAILTISAIAVPLGSVDAVGDFLDIKRAKIQTDSSEFEKAKMFTSGDIPVDGSGGAFGYGIISGASLEAIAVTTTHGGVLDSEA